MNHAHKGVVPDLDFTSDSTNPANNFFETIPPGSCAYIYDPFPEVPTEPSTVSAPDFPTDCLSIGGETWLRDHVEAVAANLQVGCGMAALLDLAAISGALQDKLTVVRGDWTEHAGLYVVVSAPPGSRKSSTFKEAFAPLSEWDRENHATLTSNFARADARSSSVKAQIRKLESALERCNGETEREGMEIELANLRTKQLAEPPPAVRRTLVDEGTVEALTRVCASQGGYLCIAAPEGDILDIIAGRYSGGKGNGGGSANLRLLKSGYNGEPYSTERVTRPGDTIPRVVLTVALATQPDVLQGMSAMPGFRGQGILDRFDYYQQPDNMGTRLTGEDRPPVPEDVRRAYRENVKKMLTLGGTDLERWANPARLHFTAEALAESYSIERDYEARMEVRSGEWRDAGGDMVRYGSKVLGKVHRLAGLLHVVKHLRSGEPFTKPVDLDCITRARDIVNDFTLPQARAAFSLMDPGPESASLAQFLGWVRTKATPVWQYREAEQALHKNAPFRKSDALLDTIRRAEAMGYVREGIVAGKKKARECYVTHPNLTHLANYFSLAER